MNSYFNPVVDMSSYFPQDIETDLMVATRLGLGIVTKQTTPEGPISYYTYEGTNVEETTPLKRYSSSLPETLKLIDMLAEEVPTEDITFYLYDPKHSKMAHNWLIMMELPNNVTYTGFGRTMSIAVCRMWCKYQDKTPDGKGNKNE